MNTELFKKFAPVLVSASAPVVRDPRLLMSAQDDIAIYYSPFEHINPKAKIVLVGITPGPTQMVNANSIARRELQAGASYLEAIRKAKEEGAFSGKVMRSNLSKQLDHWGVQTWMGIKSSTELFDGSEDLVQTTSLLRYPIFINGENYRGTPDMTRHPLLRKHLLEHFVREVQEMPDAIFIPLGPQVQKVVDTMVLQGNIPRERIIRGMLHPSGNNTYRITYLISKSRGTVPYATNPVPYDNGRMKFRQAYL